MKYLLTLLLVLMMSPAFAEKQHDIEFQLPPHAQDWKMTRNHDCVLYQPVFNDQELFIVGSLPNQLDATKLSDAQLTALFLKSFTKSFPYAAQIDVTILEKTKDSFMLEISIKEGPSSLGWVRFIANAKGDTSVLIYATLDDSNADATRSIWLPVLQTAHE